MALHFSDDPVANAELLDTLGFSYIPIRRGQKKAAVSWAEFQRRRPSHDEVQEWARRYDSWAIITGAVSGIVVVDCDSPKALAWATQNLPHTPMQVLTGAKYPCRACQAWVPLNGSQCGRCNAEVYVDGPGFRGRHLYYRHPGIRVGNRARIHTGDGKIALDLRGDGGYVLAPGSPHPSGLRYEAVEGFGDVLPALLPALPVERLVHDDEPAETPLLPHLRAVPNDTERFRRAQLWIAKRDPAIQGQGGDDHTFRTACNLVRGFDLDDHDAMAILLQWNAGCRPPWREEDLQAKIDNARVYGKDPFGCLLGVPFTPTRPEPAHPLPAPAPAPELPVEELPALDWVPPEPLLTFDAPPFPLGVLPQPFQDYAAALSVATQTPPDLAGMLILAAAAASLQRKFRAEARDGWEEPLSLFSATVLPPANRKSTVLTSVMKPLQRWEHLQREKMGPALLEIQETRAAMERQLEGMRKRGESVSAIVAVRQELERLKLQGPPRLLADDITPERVASLMAENGERLAIFSAEGGLFETLAGRYSTSGSANLDVFLKSHAGEALKVDRQRKEREPVYLENPALTLGLAVQPEVLDGLFHQPGFRGRGLLGRFLFTQPASWVGSREICPPPVPARLTQAYRATLLRLLDTVHAMTETVTLPYEDHANAALIEFEARLEPRLHPDTGDLGDLADWAGKAAGLSVRLGGILSILSILSYSTEFPLTSSSLLVSRESAEKAILLVEDYLIPHAQNAFARMGADPLVEDARRILVTLQGRDRFSKRELHRALHQQIRFRRAEDLDAPLARLERMGYIRKTQADRQGPGRPASQAYLVNPFNPLTHTLQHHDNIDSIDKIPH